MVHQKALGFNGGRARGNPAARGPLEPGEGMGLSAWESSKYAERRAQGPPWSLLCTGTQLFRVLLARATNQRVNQ